MTQPGGRRDEVTVCLRTRPDRDGRVVDIVEQGRYLDRWVRREDGWRISERRYVADIQEVLDASMSPASTAVRDTTDHSYRLFARRA